MPRYLFRVQYTLSDSSVAYEPIAVQATTLQAALDEVTAATARFTEAAPATRTITLVTTV